MSPEEAARFLAAAVQSRYGAVFEFALATGMRPGEYLGLQWRDVDLEKGIVTVKRSLIWKNKGDYYYFSEPKTLRSNRSIPLPRSVIFSLIKHKRKQAEERLRAGASYGNLDLIFATPEGSPLKPRNMREAFKVVLKNAGLSSSIRLYDLRHTCATLLLVAGENPKVVSERLGHSSITLTMDVYSHVLPNMQEAASAKLENILFSKVGTL
ncbi:MAG: site-specific integrase [Acidobacteriota bacterium]